MKNTVGVGFISHSEAFHCVAAGYFCRLADNYFCTLIWHVDLSCCCGCVTLCPVLSLADERREEGTGVGQPPGHSDENSGGDSGHERTGDSGPEWGWSLMQRAGEKKLSAAATGSKNWKGLMLMALFEWQYCNQAHGRTKLAKSRVD